MKARSGIIVCALLALVTWAMLLRASTSKDAASDVAPATAPRSRPAERETPTLKSARRQANASLSGADPTPHSAPPADDSHTLLHPTDAPSAHAALFPETPVGRMLEQHWQVASTPSPTLAEGEQKHEASLRQLRANAKEASALLAENYRTRATDHYASRWIAASTLAALESDHAYEPLREIALSELPPPPAQALHDDPTEIHELTYRIVATDGLAKLARRGNRRAETDLLAIATGELGEVAEVVRVRAIKGYLDAGADTGSRAALLKEKLPESDHWAITLDTLSKQEFAELAQQLAPPDFGGTAPVSQP